MISILQTEFFRLKKSKLFWILLAVTAVLPLISALLNLGLFMLAEGTYEIEGIEVNMWELLRSSDMLGSGLAGLTSFMGDSFIALICTSIFLSKEFSGGTFRNMLLANKSRRELYLSYLTVAIVIGAAFLGASFVSTFVFWSAIFGFGGLSATTVITACLITIGMGLVSTIFVQTMMCMFMFGTRKLAVALVCPLVIAIIAPSILFSFVDTLTVFGVISEADLSWIPLYNAGLLTSVTDVDGALIGKILMYNVPLSVFFGFMGWVRFRKADLK
ncbi:MAG: ABC transporter permease [Clostridiales bacterium]|nr:ABC transporter permease [Clostridiales bacterium]